MKKLINPNNISHIEIYDTKEGRLYEYLGYVKYKYLEADVFYFLWLFPIINYPEGFYKSWCKREYITNDTPIEVNPKKEYVLLDSVYTKPFIKIFSGGKEIHREFFEDIKDAEKHVSDNYKDVKVRYEK